MRDERFLTLEGNVINIFKAQHHGGILLNEIKIISLPRVLFAFGIGKFLGGTLKHPKTPPTTTHSLKGQTSFANTDSTNFELMKHNSKQL
jgi:hypothetical protein